MSMRRWHGILWVALTLAIAGAAVSAPLSVLWPLEGLSGRIGWRYERGFTSWPGPYWRGPDQPPLEAQVNAPATWGVLRLDGRFATTPQPLTYVAEASVPLTDEQPTINGALGYDEWAQALPVIMPLDDGQELFLLLERSDTMLYLCLAAPSVSGARGGQQAELYLDLGKGDDQTVTPLQRLLQATIQSPTQTALSAFNGEKGVWVPAPTDKLGLGARAMGGSNGDGAWAYPVFEFALPLDQIADHGKRLEQIRFMARLQTIGSGKRLPVPQTPAREAVYWPDGRSAYGVSSSASLGLRPDAWVHLQVRPDDPEAGLAVPLASGPVRVDGQIGLKEWKGAACAEYRLPGNQYRLLRVLRDEEHVYVAVRTRLARGLRTDESCGLYLDPDADGGLRPRGDDRLYRMPLGCDLKGQVLHFVGDQWEAIRREPCVAASFPLNDYESSYEFALPLALFDKPQAPNLAVEVSYELPR
ncbi:MAG: hypothetical protein WCP21_01525 [Armatimonadota bacterium]